MMADATRHYAIRVLAAAAVIFLLFVAVMELRGRDRADRVISQLLVADTGQLPALIKEIDADLGRTGIKLDRIANDPNSSPKHRLNAGLALLPFEKAHDDYLFERLLSAEPNELDRFRRTRAIAAGRLRGQALGRGKRQVDRSQE